MLFVHQASAVHGQGQRAFAIRLLRQQHALDVCMLDDAHLDAAAQDLGQFAGDLDLVVAGTANAKPPFAEKEGVKCTYCHTQPPQRNYRGNFYKANNLAFAGFDDAAEAKKAGVEVGPEASSKPKSWTAPEAPAEPAKPAAPAKPVKKAPAKPAKKAPAKPAKPAKKGSKG